MERDPWSQDLKVWENKYFKKSMLDEISNREKKKKTKPGSQENGIGKSPLGKKGI